MTIPPIFAGWYAPALRDSNPGLEVPVPFHSGEYSTTLRKAGVIIYETHYRSSVAETPGVAFPSHGKTGMTFCQRDGLLDAQAYKHRAESRTGSKA